MLVSNTRIPKKILIQRAYRTASFRRWKDKAKAQPKHVEGENRASKKEKLRSRGANPVGITGDYGMLAIPVVVSPSSGNEAKRRYLGPEMGGLTFEEMLICPKVKTTLELHIWKGYKTGAPATVSREDLVSEALIGAKNAFDSYDPSRAKSFITWLAPHVRGAISAFVMHELMKKGVSLWHFYRYRSLEQALLVFREERGLSPARKEGREALEALRNGEATEEDIEKKLRKLAKESKCKVVCLEQSLLGDEELTYTDFVDRVNAQDWEEPDLDKGKRAALLKDAILPALESLDPRERRIMEERYYSSGDEQTTLVEMGRQMGISRERARQLELRAKNKLANYFTMHPELLLFISEHLQGFEKTALSRLENNEKERTPRRKARTTQLVNRCLDTEGKIKALREYGVSEEFIIQLQSVLKQKMNSLPTSRQ